MFEITSTKEVGPSLGSLIVQIDRTGDRFQHSVWFSANGRRFKVLQSIEGNDMEESPPSPPIQDLSVENRPVSQVALGVGMAGASHWSISMEAAASQGRIVFDVACHARAEVPDFGSMYAIEDGVELEISGGNCQFFVTEMGPGWKIQLSAPQASGVGATVDILELRRIQIRGNSSSVENQPEKGRWIYELSIEDLPE